MSRKVKIILLNTVAVLILVLASLGVYIFLNKNASVDLAYDLEQPQEIGKVYVDKLDNYVVAMARTLSESGEAIVEMKKDRPEVRLKKWDGEVDLGISYKKIKTQGTASLQSNKVVWQAADMSEEVHAYPLSAKRGMEDGGLEIEVVLNSLPQTNVFEFEIDGYEDLNFFYQPKTISEELKIIVGADAIIPENVKGSYAVYHKTNRDHRIGGINYATGKVFHIYRPKAIDNSGNETWSELAYNDGSLTVTVPQDFLDTAAYPVRVDPTFGYTGIGGAPSGMGQDYFRGELDQPISKGTVDSISLYCITGGNTRNFQGAVYSGLNSKLGNAGAAASCTSSAGWRTSAITTGPVVTAGTDYWASYIADASSGADELNFYYDVGSYGTNNYLYHNTVTYPTFPSSGVTGGTALRVSLYATYAETPAVSAGVIIPWSGAAADIPAGWSRVTALDGNYVEATSTTPLATQYGSATHTHTSPTHFHSATHSHANGSTGVAVSGSANAISDRSALSETGHTHAASFSSASYNNNTASAALSSESNDPPYTEVIWIESDGTAPGLPELGWSFLHTDSLPTDWNRVSTGRFLKGAGTGNDGGATGGVSNAHSHTDSGHTHTEASHTHLTTVSADSAGDSYLLGEGGKEMISAHTNSVSGGSVVATETSGTGVLANGDGQPPFYILNILQNNTGASSTPVGIIAMWTGAAGGIPAGWEACDGTGTCPDLSDYFIKGATGDSEVGTTQDTNTHTHSAGTSHTHTRNSHTHSFTVGSYLTGTGYRVSGSFLDPAVASYDHGHSLSTTNCGTSCTTGSATVTASANTDNQPLHKDAIFIYFNGVPTITDILDSPDPVSQGSSITFDFDWDDIAGDLIKAKLCKSNGLTNMNCDGGFWASSSVYTNDDPETLFYNTTESDYPEIEWYGYVCDSGSNCSNATSGTTTISLASPAGSGIKLKSGTIKINLDDFKHILFVSFLAPLPFLIRKRKKDD